MTTYALLKLLHVLAVVAFMGNITTGLFWMRQAERSGNPAIIRFTMQSIIRSDRWFTIPGVLLISVAGVTAAVMGGLPLLKTGWICWSLVLFLTSGIVFMAKVGPLQKKVVAMVERTEGTLDQTVFRGLMAQWKFWGTVALCTPLGALVMMVLKLPVKSGL